MAGPACKVVIDSLLGALASAIERVLLDPDVHMGRIPETDRLDLVQRLADIELAAWSGSDMPHGGVSGLLLALEKHKVVTAEIWEILRRPELAEQEA